MKRPQSNLFRLFVVVPIFLLTVGMCKERNSFTIYTSSGALYRATELSILSPDTLSVNYHGIQVLVHTHSITEVKYGYMAGNHFATGLKGGFCSGFILAFLGSFIDEDAGGNVGFSLYAGTVVGAGTAVVGAVIGILSPNKQVLTIDLNQMSIDEKITALKKLLDLKKAGILSKDSWEKL